MSAQKFVVQAGATGASSKIWIDGDDVSSSLESATLQMGVGELTRLTVTYVCYEGVDAAGKAVVHHVCPLQSNHASDDPDRDGGRDAAAGGVTGGGSPDEPEALRPPGGREES